MTKRRTITGQTKNGKTVEMFTSTQVDGGLTSYVYGPHGFAVLVFVPTE